MNCQCQVHLLVRGGKLRASGTMQDRVFSHPSVEVHFNVSVDDAVGDSKGQLSGLRVKNAQTGDTAVMLQLCHPGTAGKSVCLP